MQDRHLTVSRLYRPRCPSWATVPPPGRDVPFLRFSGGWLEEAGFEIGRRVRVEIEEGRLTVLVEEG